MTSVLNKMVLEYAWRKKVATFFKPHLVWLKGQSNDTFLMHHFTWWGNISLRVMRYVIGSMSPPPILIFQWFTSKEDLSYKVNCNATVVLPTLKEHKGHESMLEIIFTSLAHRLNLFLMKLVCLEAISCQNDFSKS